MTIFIKKKHKILDPLLWILFFQLFIFFGQFLICALQNPDLIFFVLQSIWFMSSDINGFELIISMK